MPLATEERLFEESTVKDVVGSFDYKGPFKAAIDIANHYGFHLIKPIDRTNDEQALRRDESLSFYTSNLHPNISTPAFFCHTQYPRRKQGLFSFDIIGYEQPLAEALAIKTSFTILKNHGHNNILVDVNALGSPHNWNNFLEAFGEYYRNNYSKLGDCCQRLLKEDQLQVAHCQGEACERLYGRAPKPIDFLSSDELSHTRDVLEYLEKLEVPYRINHRLISHRNDGTRLLFSLSDTSGSSDEITPVGVGERYRIHHGTNGEGEKKTLSGVHLTLNLKAGKHESYKERTSTKLPAQKPTVYFMHIGQEAKQRSVGVLELLRGLNAHIAQAIYLDTLEDQLARAKREKVHVSLIMGVKEVRENAIIVRNMDSQVQSTVSLSRLKSYLKRLLKRFK